MGVLAPATSALLHNTSTLCISMHSMTNLLKDEEKKRSLKRDDFTNLSGSKMGQIIGVRQVKEKGDGKDMETDAEAK